MTNDMTEDATEGELPQESWRETGRSLLQTGAGAAAKATELLVAKTGGQQPTLLRREQVTLQLIRVDRSRRTRCSPEARGSWSQPV